jgi:membrane-associated protease RseP (regulator of RpoE activity)
MGDAEVEFSNLIAGEYKLQTQPSGVMKISIPQVAGQKIQFQPLPFNAYLVTGGGGVDVGIKDGDYVVEIDGTAFTDMGQRRQLVADAQKKESTTWVVIRNGMRVPVTFDGREWRNAGFRGESARVD